MGLFFAFSAYIAYMIFAYRIVRRILVVRERAKHSGENTPSATSPAAFLKTAGDILFFPRLFSENPRLWIGEWIFHASFSLVMLRHLRYVVEPVPGWVAALQQPGVWAGYILPFSLIYILAVREIDKKKYVSGLNSALAGIVLFAGFTGLLSRCPVKGILPLTTPARTDIAGIKDYMIGLFSFAPDRAPDDSLFGIHFISALVLLAYLPAHIFAAPLSLLSSREREDALRLLMDGEQRPLSERRSSAAQDAGACLSGEEGAGRGARRKKAVHDGRKIIAGLFLVLGIAVYPFCHNAFSGMTGHVVLKSELPKDEKECIGPKEEILAGHKDLLGRWMTSAVRNGVRTYEAKNGRSHRISLNSTCMRCHRDHAVFCDRCHKYLAVDTTCWDCHMSPKQAGPFLL